MVDSMVRRNGSCPSIVHTLPDFSKVDEKKTIVQFTRDVMLAAAQKYMTQGVSTHNGAHTRVIRLVGENHRGRSMSRTFAASQSRNWRNCTRRTSIS